MVFGNKSFPSGATQRTYLLPEHPEDCCCCGVLRINVCGAVYETLRSTVEKYPNTLLGSEEKRKKFFSKVKNEYYFDRNRHAFDSILYYYQSGGVLIRPSDIPMFLFEEEVEFFQLGERVITRLRESEGYDPPPKSEEPELRPRCYSVMWNIVEHPDSSQAATIFAAWSVSIILLSIIMFVMESMPVFRRHMFHKNIHNNSTPTTTVRFGKEKLREPWDSIDLSFVIWFTVEYLLRLFFAPKKWIFLKSFLNIIDLIAVLPYYVSLMVRAEGSFLPVLRVIRMIRVFRVLKLSRYSTGLQVLGETIRSSLRELAMIVYFLSLGVVLFASAIYYAEREDNAEHFSSIPEGFWYCIVSMTTVGYGDKVPMSTGGKLIGTACALSGVLTLALPLPIIGSNFQQIYQRSRMEALNKKRMAENKEAAGSISPSKMIGLDAVIEKENAALL